nr:phosphoribosylanthranilate isomerase [Chthoniobacterales bacterium]
MLEFENKVAVKICGVTNVRDAITCAEAGADMLGLNFSARSLRCVEPKTAREIVEAVRAKFPRTKLVGVFLDQDAALVKTVAADLALDAVQLHGNETPDYVRELAVSVIPADAARGAVVAGDGDPGRPKTRPDLPPPGSTPPATTFVIKALRVSRVRPDAAGYDCAAILLDTWSAQDPGGTGETFPWAIAAELRPMVNRLILAGGLTSANVAEAIREVRPFAVDVCSGVESALGRK